MVFRFFCLKITQISDFNSKCSRPQLGSQLIAQKPLKRRTKEIEVSICSRNKQKCVFAVQKSLCLEMGGSYVFLFRN